MTWLTSQNLNKCILPEGKAEKLYTDDELSGFGVRVRRDAKGRIRRTWFFQYRAKDGKQHRARLGNVDPPAAVPEAKARHAATKLSVEVQLGNNPQRERKETRRTQRIPLLDAATRYLDDRRAGIVGKRPMRESTFKSAQHHFRVHWAALAKRPIADIDSDDVRTEVRRIVERYGRIAAVRARSNLSAFFVWAMKEGLAKSNPVIGTHVIAENPPRERVLSDSEIAAIWHGCNNDDFGRIIQLLFLTGCRRSEIGGLKWAELDLDNSAMTIPPERVKNGQALRLKLPPTAMNIIRSCTRQRGRDYLFGISGGQYSRWGYAKVQLDKRIAECGHQLPEWHLHDIRRTVRSRLSKLGIPPHIAELMLGHTGHRTKLVKTYDRYDYGAEIADALAKWSHALLAIVEPPKTGNIARLRA